MTIQRYLMAGALTSVALFMAMPAHASYMSECNEYISTWQSCTESGKVCKTEFKVIETECKCHRFQQGEWKLVMAAVGKDGVCAPLPEDIPDPSPPPHDDETRLGDPWHSDKEDDPKKKDEGGKPQPVTTHGGERAPGEKAPNERD